MEQPDAPARSSKGLSGKITRSELATHCRLSLRTIDELTRNGVLPHFKIGKAVRYDLDEVEAAMRQRFHVQPKAKKFVGNNG